MRKMSCGKTVFFEKEKFMGVAKIEVKAHALLI